MLRAVLTPRWLGALILSAIFAAISYNLGHWQYGRHEFKRDRAERVESHFGAPVVPVTSVLGATPLPLEREWTHVEASGEFAGPHVVVRNRSLGGTYGYEVLAPFRLADGSLIAVDRGWVAYGEGGAATPPSITPSPPGQRTIRGWLRVGERSRGRDLPAGQLASVNLAELAAAFGSPVLGGYLQKEADADSQSAGSPTPLGRPDVGLGPHQAYAFQWWASMPLGLVLVVLGIRRELRERADTVPVRKSRIWDEEDA